MRSIYDQEKGFKVLVKFRAFGKADLCEEFTFTDWPLVYNVKKRLYQVLVKDFDDEGKEIASIEVNKYFEGLILQEISIDNGCMMRIYKWKRRSFFNQRGRPILMGEWGKPHRDEYYKTKQTI